MTDGASSLEWWTEIYVAMEGVGQQGCNRAFESAQEGKS